MGMVSALKDRMQTVRFVFSDRVTDRYTFHRPWIRVVAETVSQIKRDDATLMAAGVAYYAVLSLFPLTLLLLSILSFFTDSASSRANLENFFGAYLPDSVGFVDQIADQDMGITGIVGVAGFIGLIWSGTAMMSALSKAVNRAFGISSNLPFYKDRPLSILLGLGIIAAFALSLFGSAAIESVSQFNVPLIGRQAWVQVFARFIPFGVTMATFTLVYRVLPRVNANWNHILPSALLATVLFELAKVLFLIYLNRGASFEIYGGMALLVVLMVWSYFSAFVVLVGAELVAARRYLATQP